MGQGCTLPWECAPPLLSHWLKPWTFMETSDSGKIRGSREAGQGTQGCSALGQGREMWDPTPEATTVTRGRGWAEGQPQCQHWLGRGACQSCPRHPAGQPLGRVERLPPFLDIGRRPHLGHLGVA